MEFIGNKLTWTGIELNAMPTFSDLEKSNEQSKSNFKIGPTCISFGKYPLQKKKPKTIVKTTERQ